MTDRQAGMWMEICTCQLHLFRRRFSPFSCTCGCSRELCTCKQAVLTPLPERVNFWNVFVRRLFSSCHCAAGTC